jgi:hypothetical protein
MNPELKKLIDARDDTEALLIASRKKLDSVREELQGLVATLPDIQKRLKLAETEKIKTLEDFVLGASNQKELDQARGRANKAREEEQNSLELIDAMTRVISTLENEIPVLDKRALDDYRACWSLVFELESEKIRENLGERLLRAYAVKLLAGGASWEGILKGVFIQTPEHQIVEEMKTRLIGEYKIGGI